MRCSSGQSRNEDRVVLMNDVVDAVCPFVGGDDLVDRDAMGGGDTEQRVTALNRRPHRSLPHRATPNVAYTTRPKATPTNTTTNPH